MKKVGTVLVAVLLIVAALAVVTGVIESVWVANQVSPVAQQFVNPDVKPSTFPITTLTSLKNQKQKLEVIKATTVVVDKEYADKIAGSQASYDKLIGTVSNPGVLGAVALAALTMYGTNLYNKNKLYTADEVKAIKEGKEIL